ncbi:MAG: DUF4139 domain-containing protein, partial [Gammaproteobacteria bacterium]|nr:DUF4139 domain-containing protein [Gammaproteobacteria bacterium]
MKRYVLTTSIAFIWAGIAWASNPDRVSLTIYGTGQPGSVPTTMYRPTPGVTTEPYGTVPGFAVVKQERSVELNAGHDHVRFTDVTALIDPTTVSFDSLTDPAGTRVLDQDYRFDLVDTRQLLDRYVDQEITVHQGLGDDHSTFTGVLLSARDGLLLKGSNGDVQNFRSYSRIEFPELPNGLVTKPTLVWNLTTRTSGEHRVRVTYQTEGITWWADYILTYQEGEDANACSVDVSAWVSIVNRSGASFADAGLKLIAGDVNRVSQPAVRTELARTLALAEDVSSGFTEKPFF